MKQAIYTLAQLKAQYAGHYIPYQTLLGTQEWRIKRDMIVERDKGKCTKCGTLPTDNVWLNGKMHYILSIQSDPNEIIKIGEGLEFFRWEIGNDMIDVGGPIILHVHHLYYEKSKHPWEYPGEALITLCNDCHLEAHKKEVIPVYGIDNGSRIKLPVKTCSRCNGAGYFPQYNHVEAGVCFACKGSRYIDVEL